MVILDHLDRGSHLMSEEEHVTPSDGRNVA